MTKASRTFGRRAGGVLLLLAAVVPAGGAFAQTPCVADCIAVDTLVTLDFTSTTLYPSAGGLLARGSGREPWIYVDRQVPYEIWMFDASGAHRRTAGRMGDGPGEYPDGPAGISALAMDGADSLWVFSLGGRRADLYGGDLAWARTLTLDERVAAAAPLGAGRLVVLARSGGGGLPGMGGAPEGVRLATLSRQGELTPLAGGGGPERLDPMLSPLASDGEGRFWVAEPHVWRVWEGSPDGAVRMLTAGAEPEWFGETFSAAVRSEFADFLDTGGATILTLAYDAASGHLLATVGVPSSRATPAQVRGAFESGDPIAAAAVLLDHVVVAIDPRDGRIVAERRFDHLPVHPGGAHPYAVERDALMHVLAPRAR